MSDQRDGGISWTDETWNPVRGCSRVSPGCVNCYAERVAARFSGPGQPYDGLAIRKLKTLGEDDDTSRIVPRWTGVVRLVPEHLADPLRWRRQRRVFVNSMSDLFHERLTNEEIAAVFGVMAAAPRHVFQALTKRPERMIDWFRWMDSTDDEIGTMHVALGAYSEHYMPDVRGLHETSPIEARINQMVEGPPEWPLPNVHVGVSVEDQQRADERIPLLLQTPAAVRFLSVEPLLGPVDLTEWLYPDTFGRLDDVKTPAVDWVIVGAESGPGARPCRLEWVRSLVEQCRAAGVPVWVKQLQVSGKLVKELDEFPEDLRIRELPR